jgi:hypothetical protein
MSTNHANGERKCACSRACLYWSYLLAAVGFPFRATSSNEPPRSRRFGTRPPRREWSLSRTSRRAAPCGSTVSGCGEGADGHGGKAAGSLHRVRLAFRLGRWSAETTARFTMRRAFGGMLKTRMFLSPKRSRRQSQAPARSSIPRERRRTPARSFVLAPTTLHPPRLGLLPAGRHRRWLDPPGWTPAPRAMRIRMEEAGREAPRPSQPRDRRIRHAGHRTSARVNVDRAKT